MNQIRHLAIRSEEREKLKAYYIEAFGFREVGEGVSRFHLTDGYFELALLSNTPNQSPNGLYHFGIKVDDMDETIRKLEKWKMRVQQRPDNTSFAELRVSDIDGNLIDLSVHGFLEGQPVKNDKKD